jgi:formin-binding protein 1
VETSTITSVVGDLSMYGKNHSFKSETFKIPTNCDLCGDRIWGLSAKGFICTDCGFTCHSKCQMKVPADCPGEQTKEEKKKLKTERQAAALSAVPAPAPTNGVAAPPPLTRQDTMNSLSSGYAASATRSLSGGVGRMSMMDDQPASSPLTTATSSTPAATAVAPRRNRIVAPPPAAYVSAPAADISSNGSSQPRGKMLYAYEARGEGEISVTEGAEVKIVEPDGESNRQVSRRF